MAETKGSAILARFNAERAAARAMDQAAANAPASRGRMNSMRRTVRGLYQAAESDRLTSNWSTFPLTADQVVERNQRILVARSRQQAANNDYAKCFLRMARQNIVGPQGVTLQAQIIGKNGKLDQDANTEVERGWAEFRKKGNCDITGTQSMRALESSAVTCMGKDGEYFFRMVTGRDAGPWGFALQIIDAQRCPVDMHDERPREGGFIRQGIHFNRYGKPIYYYFTTTEAGESDYRMGGHDFVRVPAAEIIHGFLSEMVGQKRGIPWMATSLYRMRHLNGMEDAAVVNARVGAAKMGFIQWKDGHGPELDEDFEAEDLEIEGDAGAFPVLPEGAELKEWNPAYPSGEFAPFYKTMLRGMSAGYGVLYNNLASDLEGVNFSSIRQGTLDEREHWKELQELLIESFHEVVFNAWLPRALLSGKVKLPPENLDRYRNVAWQPRRWQWIDPRADVDAAVASKNNMLASPGSLIREQGRDPNTVWAESARDVRSMIEAYVAEGIDKKVAEELVLLHMGKAPKKPETEKKDEK